MLSTLAQFSVKEYSAWRMVFDSVVEQLSPRGKLSHQVFQDFSDPNQVTILMKWSSMEGAKEWMVSPERQAAMERGGVIGQPSLFYLHEK